MSSISPSGFGLPPRINPYGGSIRSTADSDAAKVDSAGRAVDASHAQQTAGIDEPADPEKTGDRDADGQFLPGRRQQRSGSDSQEPSAPGGSGPGIASTPVPSLDPHRGSVIDIEV